jgi:ubiquinone/menaquinone biosynthesis C-methylase UbiE
MPRVELEHEWPEFTIGDAMKLEFEARSFDAAVMALVIF